MQAHPVSRPADCSPQEAKQALAAKWPTARIASFGLSEDGSQFVASLVFAGDNPFAGGDDAPAEPKDDAPEAPAADDAPPADDADGDSDGPPAPKKDKGGEKGKGGDAKIEHKLDQIMQALGIPAEGGDPALGLDAAGPAGPMDGPGAGPVPPPAAPPVPDKAPLPPPAKPHGAPGAGGGGGLGMPFSHRVAALRERVAQKRTFTTVVEAGPDVPLRTVVAETAKVFPEFKPVKVERRTGRISGGETQHLVVVAMRRK